jgi:uncharacterized protein (TIGR02145 family)
MLRDIRFLLSAFTISLISVNGLAQIQIMAPSANASLPILTQKQFDEMAVPAEGYQAFNSTTGCIQYYLNQTWYRLCGDCLPETGPYTIDLTVQKGRTLFVHFTKSAGDTLIVHIKGQEEKVVGIVSPVAVRLPSTGDTATLVTGLSNKCYKEQRVAERKVPLKQAGIGPLRQEDIEGKPVNVRPCAGLIWMCDDRIAKDNRPAKDRLITYAAGSCPAGWRVPTVKEWEGLLRNYEGDPKEVFMVPGNDNGSIGLSQLGAWVVDEKAMIMEGISGYYWASDKAQNGDQYLLNITPNGYMTISGKATNARMNLRCVRDE